MKTLLIKYLNETISEAEKDQLLEWLQTPQNQKTFKEFVKINHRLNNQNINFEDERVYQDLLHQIEKSSKKASLRKLIPHWLKYAAVIVGVAIVGLGIYINSSKKDTTPAAPGITLELEDGSIIQLDENSNEAIVDAFGKRISQQKDNELIYDHAGHKELSYNTIKIPYGKIFKLSLSDGTHIVLNAGTTLRYPVNFIPGEERLVFLNGEAYFDVAEDEAHPFVVNTEDLNVKVLGTHFIVNSYQEVHKTFTVLVEGKVLVENKLVAEDQKLLKPNERVFFDHEQLAVENVNTGKYMAWMQGKLIFENDSFEYIIRKLERKYDVEIDNNYPVLDEMNITATFTNESIEEVLRTFQTYKNFEWTLKNGVVTINKPKD